MVKFVSKRKVLLLLCLLVIGVCQLQAQQVKYSFAEAKSRMLRTSNVLKVADAGMQIARKEQRRAAAWWWPQIQVEGMYAHLSEEVEVRQPLSQFTDPAKAYMQSIFPSEELVSGLLDEVGHYTLTFPLLPKDLFSADLTAEWVVFGGGKRIFTDKIARRMVDVAQINNAKVEAAEMVILVEHYYGLALAEQTIEVCRKRYEGLRNHYEHAVKLEEVGMADKATRLLAQVAMEEAQRELERAQSIEQVEQMVLKRMLDITDEGLRIIPSSALFMCRQLPPRELFLQTMQSNNPTLNTLYIEEQMASEKLRIDQSSYLPDVALFGKQTLYAHGIPSNLMPRTIVGVGLSWNIFDGLNRERQISQTRLARQSLVWSREEAENDCAIAVDELYATLLRSEQEVRVLNTTIILNEELLRMRHASFAEGIATSAEVVDAENALSEVRLARLAAYYAYDVALINLLAISGLTDSFEDYNR